MAERPDLSHSLTRLASERSQRLAERFGMTTADVDELLNHTHAEYSDASGSTLPPVPQPDASHPEAAIERAAGTVPPVNASPVPNPPSGAKPLSGGFIAGLFTVLLIGLAIAMSFREGCFQERMAPRAAKPVDTVQNMLNNAAAQASSPRPPSNVPPSVVPPESLEVPNGETTAKPSASSQSANKSSVPSRGSSSAKPLFTTSSEYQAEERLAELRADGNTRARIRATRSHGAVIYQVVGR